MQQKKIGVIGLGQIGGGIAANLVKAGYNIAGHDPKPDAMERLVSEGGRPTASIEAIVDECDTVLTCLEGKIAVSIADNILLPRARRGQTFIDHSTVPCPQTRRIGQAFVEKGCRYLDAPVSGGARGASAGTLRVFVGGTLQPSRTAGTSLRLQEILRRLSTAALWAWDRQLR